MTAAGWTALAGVGLSGLALILTISRGHSSAHADLHSRITAIGVEMASRTSALETKVDVFWRSVALPAASILHSPHPQHARRDLLLERLMAGQLARAEAGELAELVGRVETDPAATDADRLAAGTVLGYLAAHYGIDPGRQQWVRRGGH